MRDMGMGERDGRAGLAASEEALRRAREDASDIIGKFWASPDTALGLGLGVAGHVLASATGRHPRLSIGNNAVQFENNPVGGVSAVTLGNTSIYSGELHDAAHERQHTYQAQLLGPFYLPSNLVGGLLALGKDGSWHGPHNWNEVGPQMTPPRPWPSSRPR